MHEAPSTTAERTAPIVREQAVFSTSVSAGATKSVVLGPIPTGWARSVVAAITTNGTSTVHLRSLWANGNITVDDAGTACNTTSISLATINGTSQLPIGEQMEVVVTNPGGSAITVSGHIIARS